LLYGDSGADFLNGGYGPDRLNGGRGRDRLYGGPGADVLRARDGTRDVVSCGSGRDVAVVDRRDRVSTNCETVRRR
jgi:Ca2+-binding RTX toxin-like protein